MRNMEMGRTCCVSDVTCHSAVKYGMALLGSALAIVEFRTVVIVVKEIQAFFLYIGIMDQQDRPRQHDYGIDQVR